MVLSFQHIVGLTCYWSTSTASILLNSCLLLMIVLKTPRMMHPYSVLLFAQAFADLGSALCSIFAIVRILPCGTALIAAFYGPCQYFGAVVCFFTGNSMALSQNTSLNVLLALFVYRLYVLRHSVPKTSTIFCTAIALYIPSALQFINGLANYEYSEEVIEVARRHHPNESFEGVTITGAVDIFSNPTFAMILYFSLPIFPIYLGISYCQYRIRRVIHAVALSPHTKETHRKFLKVLTLQAIAPSLYIVSVFSFFHIMFVGDNILLAYTVTLVDAVISVINPVISLYYITPYREAIQCFLPINKSTVIEVQRCTQCKEVDQ